MKVVLLAPTPPPAGGIAGWTVRMLEAKLKNDWELTIVDEKAIGSRQVFGKDGKRNYWDEIKRCLNIWFGLWRKLKDPKVRIVHSCIPSVTLAMLREYVCAFITKIRVRKFIIHFRCTIPNTTQGRMGRIILRKLCNKSDLIFVLNKQSYDYLEKITKSSIRIIPNFIASEELNSDYEVRDELKTILYVGGIVENKGIYDCLEIAKKLPDINFRFVGKGNSVFEEKANEYNLSNVIFTGQKDRKGVKEEIRNADAFIFMTYFKGEGFSNALCEAMAGGLPCVVTNWAANKDMIGENGGYVVNIHDVDSAVASIEKMRSKKIRATMSAANLLKVNTEYIDRVVINQYIDAYESII